jgi:RNA 2',3'-cyclic 3'-phosphodiesterase
MRPARRLFAAIDLPEVEHDRLASYVAQARLDPKSVRLADPEQWHITLAFYGDVREAESTELLARLERVAERTSSFSIRLHRAGAFPANPRRAKVLWAGVDGDLEVMRRLADRCRAAGRRAGLAMPKERFHPHVTLARARGGTADVDRPLAHLWQWAGDPWQVSSFRLVHSTLGARVRHETVAEFSLLD